MKPDNLTVAVIWGRFTALAEEVALALSHTAYSDQVREGGDFSTAIFDGRGRLLAQANRSPAHLGSMPFAIKHMLEHFPAETLAPGDVIAMNDPYYGAGHLPDIFALSPAFLGDDLIGFICAVVHVTDIGGYVPGSQAVVGITDMIQEGLRLPPCLLYKAGVPNRDVFAIIAANVRVPDLVLGDIRAQRSALHVGASKHAELVARYGLDTVTAAAGEFLDRSEQAVRDALREIPSGSYNFVDQLDDVGPGTDPMRLEVTVTVGEDEITFDFAGTAAQTPVGFNSTLTYTRAYCYWVTKAITTRDTIPQNEGQTRPVTVTAPEGTFFNPRPPSPVAGRAILNQRIVEICFGALAQALPEAVNAASGQWVNPIFGGTDPSTGRRFVFYDYITGGVGARYARDGVDAMSPAVSIEGIPVEIQEAQYPVLVERVELMTDSGGAGRMRGGLSVRKDIRMLVDDVTLSCLTDRHKCPPYGLDGGRPGLLGQVIVNPGSSDERKLPSKGDHRLKKGDLVSVRCSGSAGYGDPSERSIAALRSDVEEFYVSAEKAREEYGMKGELQQS